MRGSAGGGTIRHERRSNDVEIDHRAADKAALLEEIRQLRATVARLRATSRVTGT